MTLMNGCVHDGTTTLWTDSLWWDVETGNPAFNAVKGFQGTFWPFAGVVSCAGEPLLIEDEIGLPADVPELLEQVRAALRAYYMRGGAGRVLLGTNLDGPRLFLIASDATGIAAPFEPAELLSFTSSGTGTAAYRRAIERGFTLKRMRRVIDAQIAEPFDGEGSLASLGRQTWIGGQIVEIEVTPAGVDSRVLRQVEA